MELKQEHRTKQRLKPLNETIPNWIKRTEEHKGTNGYINGITEGTSWISKPILNINTLKEKIINKYYLTMDDFLIDVKELIKSTFKRCDNDIAQEYVSGLYEYILNLCIKHEKLLKAETEINFYKLYKELKVKEVLRVSGKWEKRAMPRRHYFHIEEYVSGIKNDNTILERMKTKLRGNCDGTHCLSFEDLGPLSLAEETWITECSDRKHKIECDRRECGCRNLDCKNRAITDHKIKKMGVDVREIESWGLDVFTVKLIGSAMPKNISKEKVSEFIESCLITALQKQGEHGWNITLSLQYIINNDANELYKKISRHLLTLVELNRDGIDAFKVHSKGIGVICCNRSGFKKNEFINEYYGEIYPPWRWYEKQDIIKKGQNEGKISQGLPDFYNIILEKHKTDPEGYDILVTFLCKFSM